MAQEHQITTNRRPSNKRRTFRLTGDVFIWIFTWFLDLLCGFPVEHGFSVFCLVLVALYSYHHRMYSISETFLFAGITLSLLLTFHIMFSTAWLTFLADLVLILALVQASPKQSNSLLVLPPLLLLSLFLSATTLRSFGIVSHLIQLISLSSCTPLLLCRLYSTLLTQEEHPEHVLPSDRDKGWVDISTPRRVKRSQSLQETPFVGYATPRIQEIEDDEELDAMALSDVDGDTPLPNSKRKRGKSRLRALLEGRSQEEDNFKEKEEEKEEIELMEQVSNEKTSISENKGGFLDEFLDHKSEMAWLEAKGRLIKGGLFIRHRSGATPIRRFVRLNNARGKLECWVTDATKIVEEIEITSLFDVRRGTASSAFEETLSLSSSRTQGALVAFSLYYGKSFTFDLEASSAASASQWIQDFELLLANRSEYIDSS